MIALLTLLVVFATTILLSFKNEMFRIYMKQQIDKVIDKMDQLLTNKHRASTTGDWNESAEQDEAVASLLPSLSMKEDEMIQQLPDSIRQVILGSNDEPSSNNNNKHSSLSKSQQQQQQQKHQKQQSITSSFVKSEEEDDEEKRAERELLNQLNPAVQMGLKPTRSVRHLISQFEQVATTSDTQPLSDQSRRAIVGGVAVMKPLISTQQKTAQDSTKTPSLQQQREQLLDSLLPKKTLETSILDFIVDDEDYVLHLGRLIPEFYQKPIQQFRKKREEESKNNERNYELLDVLFDTLAKKMAADKSHLSLYNVKKMVLDHPQKSQLSRDVKFLNSLSEIVMQFVMESLSKEYIPYVRKYIAIRPKIQALLCDKDKSLETFIRVELDKAAENVQKNGKEFKNILSLEEMIAEPCVRLSTYLKTFRDEWYPYVKHAELSSKFVKSTEEQELIKQAAFRLENAFGKLEREMKDNFQALGKAFQMNKIYAIQKRLNMDTLSNETTDILATSSRRQDKRSSNDVLLTERIGAIPSFIYECQDESEYLYRLKKSGEKENEFACECYLFENMLILSWINTKMNRKRENMIYDLKGCTVESLGDKQFMMTILGEEHLFECKTKGARAKWVRCLHTLLENPFFSTDTTRKLAEHIRQTSAQLDTAQDYYAVPLEELYQKPHLWSCFEDKDDSYNIIYEKSDTVNSSKRTVRAATLPKLVYLLTSPSLFDNSFLHSFMMTYQSFTTSEGLIEQLTNRYNMPPPKDISLDKIEFSKFKESTLFPIRIRVCQVVKHWIQHHSYIFRNDARARNKLSQFIEQHIAKTKLFSLADELRDDLDKYTQKRDTFAEQQLRMLSQKVQDLQLTSSIHSPFKHKSSAVEPPKPVLPRSSPIKSLTKSRSKNASSIMDWSSVEISRQLTLIEFALFENIQVKECLNENWSKKEGDMAPNLNAMIQRSNLVVFFVAHEILKQSAISARAHAIQKWIKVARECRKINNFNACREIVGGLRTIPVSRLDQTWAKVDSKLKKEFDELVELVSQKKNYKNMRDVLSSCPPPCLPYVGTTLQDLTFLNEGNKDVVQNTNPKPSKENPHAPYQPQLINFFKRQKIGVVIRALQQYQQTSYIFICVPELANRLQNMVVVSEAKLFELSLAAEPEKKE